MVLAARRIGRSPTPEPSSSPGVTFLWNLGPGGAFGAAEGGTEAVLELGFLGHRASLRVEVVGAGSGGRARPAGGPGGPGRPARGPWPARPRGAGPARSWSWPGTGTPPRPGAAASDGG